MSMLDNSFEASMTNGSKVANDHKRIPLFDVTKFNSKIIDETSQDSGYASCSPRVHYSPDDYLSAGGPSPKQAKDDENSAPPRHTFFNPQTILKKQTSTSFRLPSNLHNGLRTIDCTTMTNLLTGALVNQISKYAIVDCRYPYEYEGGHIRGSLNFFQFGPLVDYLFECDGATGEPLRPKFGPEMILVFHCEFSANRAPTMARALRRLDRKLNECNYPNLCYPEVYMLKGGYKEYFAAPNRQCEPDTYRKMLDINFIDQMKQYRGVCRSKSDNSYLSTAVKSSSVSCSDNQNNTGNSNGNGVNFLFGRSRSLKF